jgi:hypothetical protein
MVGLQRRQDKQSHHQSSPFLSLPTELRLKIYEHLVPNDSVPGLLLSDDARMVDYLRHDMQPCCPALLCTNHQIHDELIDMWYGTATFEITMRGRLLHFLGASFDSRDIKLPSTFRHIRSLRIGIMIDWLKDQSSNTFNHEWPWWKLIADSLSVGPYKLRHVSLYDGTFYKSNMPMVINSCLKDGGRQLKMVLEWNLGPLRTLRGVDLQLADITLVWGSKVGRSYIITYSGKPNEVVIPVLNRIQRIRQRFLQKLAEDITQNT